MAAWLGLSLPQAMITNINGWKIAVLANLVAIQCRFALLTGSMRPG